MKKTIFLLFMIVLFGTHSVGATTRDITVFEFDEFNIILDYFYNGETGQKGYYMEKVGPNPFKITLLEDNAWVEIERVKLFNEKIVLYGDVHYLDGATFYDAYLLIMDELGNTEFEYIHDDGQLEFIDDVAYINNTWLFRQHHATREDRGPEFTHYTFMTYDNNYQPIDELMITSEIHKKMVEGDLYFFETSKQHYYDYALNSELHVYDEDDLLSIAENEHFEERIFLPIINKALVNYEWVYNGHLIDYPGNYNVQYNGLHYNFVVDPKIDGVEDGKVYIDPVEITVHSGEAYLNNDALAHGETVSKPGFYTLTIFGVGGYEKTVEFQINAGIDGVVNEQVYEDEVEVEFNGNGYLNQQYIESPFIVSTPGDYVLQVEGENSYSEVVHFSIDETADDTSWLYYIQKYDVIVLAVVGLSAYLYLKKK